MTRTSTLLAATGLATFLLASSSAFAQSDAAKPDDPRKAQAGVLLNEGLQLHDQDKENEALAKFQESYRIFPSPNVLFNIAREEQLLQKPLDAIRDYRKALRSPLLDPQRRDAARSYIAELEPKLAKISVRASGGALVSVDGALIEEHAPLPEAVDVAPGRHFVEAKDTKGKVVRVEVSCAAGETQRANLVEETVVEPPQTEIRKKALPPPTATLILGGVAAVGLGLGVGFGLASQGKKTDLDSATCPGGGLACQTRSDLKSSGETDATISTVSYVVGGVALAGAVITWIAWPRKSVVPVTGFSIAPDVGPRAGGLRLRATF